MGGWGGQLSWIGSDELYGGISQSSLQQLQRVQKAAAWILVSKKSENMTSSSKERKN